YKRCQGLNSWHVSNISTYILKVDRTDILIVNIYLILVINAQIALEPLLLLLQQRENVREITKKVRDHLKKNKRQENRIKILKNDLSGSVKKIESMVTSDITEKLKRKQFS
ncbi:Uncharacterized protein FWK35_00000640, partial [Aphis craccivora]